MLRLPLTIALLVAVSGCASLQVIEPFDNRQAIETVSVVQKNVGMNDYPLGTHVIDANQLMVVRHVPISAANSSFGLLGALVSNSANASKVEQLVGALEPRLAVDYVAEFEQALGRAQSDGLLPRGWRVGTGKSNALRIRPLAYLILHENEQAGLGLRLIVDYYDAGGSNSWESNYVIMHERLRPLAGGRDSWSSPGVLAGVMQADYRQLLQVMARDLQQGARWKGQMVTAQRVSIFGGEFTAEAELLERDRDAVIIRPKTTRAAVDFGVSVYAPDQIRINP